MLDGASDGVGQTTRSRFYRCTSEGPRGRGLVWPSKRMRRRRRMQFDRSTQATQGQTREAVAAQNVHSGPEHGENGNKQPSFRRQGDGRSCRAHGRSRTCMLVFSSDGRRDEVTSMRRRSTTLQPSSWQQSSASSWRQSSASALDSAAQHLLNADRSTTVGALPRSAFTAEQGCINPMRCCAAASWWSRRPGRLDPCTPIITRT